MTYENNFGPQIALGTHGEGGVAIWADVIRVADDGTIDFEVINGAWAGKLKDNTLTIASNDGPTEDTFEAELLWQGKAPFGDGDYNEAIKWIEAEIAKRKIAINTKMEDWAEAEGYDLSFLLSEGDHTPYDRDM